MNKIIDKIINLTPHAINLMIGEKSMEIQPSGVIARCEEKTEILTPLEYPVSDIHGYPEVFPIPIIKKELGKVSLDNPEWQCPCPDYQDETINCGLLSQCGGMPNNTGTIYIVSFPVAQVLKRSDVFAIGESIRNDKGQVIGCKSLAQI